MAVAAVHPQLAGMEAMAVLHRLLRLVAHDGELRREVVPNQKDENHAPQQRADKRKNRQDVGPFREDLRHSEGCAVKGIERAKKPGY